MPTALDTQHQKHIEAARRRVAHLAAMSDATADAERQIRDAAQTRLETVEAELAKVTPRAILHDGAAEQHATLLKERARLHTVIANADAALAGA